MKWSISNAAILVAALSSVAAGAQSRGTMAKGDMMEMMDATYAGCIEAGTAAGTFRLTQVSLPDQMGKDMMKKDAMATDGMSKDAMAPTTLTLTGSLVDLGKHLGHKVSVTGSPAHEKMEANNEGTMGKAATMFTVKSLKMIAAACS